MYSCSYFRFCRAERRTILCAVTVKEKPVSIEMLEALKRAVGQLNCGDHR